MSSYNLPSGNVTFSSELGADQVAWKAFAEYEPTTWNAYYSTKTDPKPWVCYEFPIQTKSIACRIGQYHYMHDGNIQVQGSKDGVNFTLLAEITIAHYDSMVYGKINNIDFYKYYKFIFNKFNESNNPKTFRNIQLYDR